MIKTSSYDVFRCAYPSTHIPFLVGQFLPSSSFVSNQWHYTLPIFFQQNWMSSNKKWSYVDVASSQYAAFRKANVCLVEWKTTLRRHNMAENRDFFFRNLLILTTFWLNIPDQSFWNFNIWDTAQFSSPGQCLHCSLPVSPKPWSLPKKWGKVNFNTKSW